MNIQFFTTLYFFKESTNKVNNKHFINIETSFNIYIYLKIFKIITYRFPYKYKNVQKSIQEVPKLYTVGISF